MTDLPGYDAWKLASPDDDAPESICPWCGAWSRRNCEMEEEMGSCPWEDSEPDPDHLRDIRDEDRVFFDRMEGDD